MIQNIIPYVLIPRYAKKILKKCYAQANCTAQFFFKAKGGRLGFMINHYRMNTSIQEDFVQIVTTARKVTYIDKIDLAQFF